MQQNNFQTYSFNQSCTGVQHLTCQRVLNICHICVSSLKLLPCVQLMYYSYLQGGREHLNAPHPCLSLSSVHAKGVSWHLIYHVRLSASYVLTGFVVFTAIVWYIYYCEGCFFFKSMTYLEKDLFWYCTVLWLLSSGEYVNLREYKLQFEMSDAISWRLDRST